jgi:predicted kinase
MKSFLQLVEEKDKTSKPVVMAFGRMNPPTTGHLKLIDKVKSTAEKMGAKHTVIVSHSQDSKKNPLSGAQKIKHLKRYAPGVHFEASSKEHPTIMHHAARLHAAGHDHLVMVAGSDRVKEYHDLLHKYNGVPDKTGKVPYNFKKITVVSAGHRDPDAEGAEGMSGTKMREHAKNNDFSSFRQGVPSHVSDAHARDLMKDTRKGMGLHESVDRGMFKAIFITGGPGSGKDIVIRESIAEGRAVELNLIQAFDYLADKQALSEKSQDFRREAIRNRGPLIINGPAEDKDRISYINEELQDLGYQTLMIFVETSNEESRNRNESLKRMMVESIREEKWQKSIINKEYYGEIFEMFVNFENNGSINTKEFDIDFMYNLTNKFLDLQVVNETAISWLENHGRLNINDKFNRLLKEENNVEKISRIFEVKAKTSSGKFSASRNKADGPGDISPDNRSSSRGVDDIKFNAGKKTSTYTFGSGAGVYAEAKGPTLSISPPAKEPNFQKDNNKEKVKKRGDKSQKLQGLGKPPGVGPEYDTRAGGQGAAAGAGLGNQTYSESQDYSNASPSSTAMPGSSALQPNPLTNAYDGKKKDFKKFKDTIKEFNGFQNDVESGVGGVLGGSGNKEGMDTYKDTNRNIQNDYGLKIKKKKKQEK